MPKSEPQKTRLLTRNDLRALGIQWVNVHQLRLERQGHFPKRIHLSPYKVAWFESEVLEWLETKAKERD